MRAHTRAELGAALDEREVDPGIRDELLERFTDVDLIDDAQFAKQWVSARQRGRRLAPRALAQELRHKGVDAETAAEALATIDQDDVHQAATELAQKKLATMSRLDPVVQRRRTASLLARKGYDSALIWRVIAECMDGTDDDGVASVPPE